MAIAFESMRYKGRRGLVHIIQQLSTAWVCLGYAEPRYTRSERPEVITTLCKLVSQTWQPYVALNWLIMNAALAEIFHRSIVKGLWMQSLNSGQRLSSLQEALRGCPHSQKPLTTCRANLEFTQAD